MVQTEEMGLLDIHMDPHGRVLLVGGYTPLEVVVVEVQQE